jgi:FixJ family two-component response regulator
MGDPQNRGVHSKPVVALIGVVDDESVRDALGSLVRSTGYLCAVFPSAEVFLDSGPPKADSLLQDIRMPGLSGFELQCRLHEMNLTVPDIFVTGEAQLRRRSCPLR